MTRVPVAVLTNGSLLWQPEVREALMEADLVLPSLDVGDESLFHLVNRPEESLSFEKMTQGLIDFSEEFPGSVWLEVFLLAGVTGILTEVKKISAFIKQIRPGRVHLNTVSRPPAEAFAFPVPGKQMKQFASVLGDKTEVINENSPGERSTFPPPGITGADILDLLSRRPCTVQDVSAGLGLNPPQVSKQLQELLRKGAVKTVRRDAAVYFKAERSRWGNTCGVIPGKKVEVQD
jgi:wyosine [tRNA(Phe)-imidazoG37] synthetase (radical SAM superfamily)